MPTLFASDTNFSISDVRDVNTSSPGGETLQVICAWPVSSQYGPGTRLLYYVLVAACVVARKNEWLKRAVLAAALLVPAVAAIHAVVLAALHNQDAVDMDIFGALQICAIGILAAPVTVRLSSTYFNDSGRNLIFLWTGLLLTGLLSLTVEFYRTNPCDPENGPFSILRGGSANNIYVVPAPERLSFAMATLLSAGCCIPAILSLISMRNRILDINWRTRAGRDGQEDEMDMPIEGTRATLKSLKKINETIKNFLTVVEVAVFSGLVMAILVIGEINFWSPPVRFQVEPMATAGQWSPIAGTILGFIGSLYLLLANAAKEEDKHPRPLSHDQPCECQHHDSADPNLPSPGDHPLMRPAAVVYPDSRHLSIQDISGGLVSSSLGPQATISNTANTTAPDAGNRRKVAKWILNVGEILGTAPPDWDADIDFQDGPARGFPQIPGENLRSRDLQRILAEWTPSPRPARGCGCRRREGAG
ncbi:hypothetical protein P8C59_002787 [Phyllachora maydis]|uniref:Transmembrane protein n=1 Tax=Phyllachora maydis TaxID=1825666 RepID=A0AAD9I036_9PEZI|nr:hypothetical protein P8C59_002787 [Phyllachora maydis]